VPKSLDRSRFCRCRENLAHLRQSMPPPRIWQEFDTLMSLCRSEDEVALLEVACGTGRLHTFIKVSFHFLSISRLSPYLASLPDASLPTKPPYLMSLSLSSLPTWFLSPYHASTPSSRSAVEPRRNNLKLFEDLYLHRLWALGCRMYGGAGQMQMTLTNRPPDRTTGHVN